MYREGLMTYKQFISELEDDVSPSEAERRHLLLFNIYDSESEQLARLSLINSWFQ